MKKILSLLFLVPACWVSAQVSDHFSDGDFTSDPRWIGDSSKFEVNTLQQLHLKAEGSDTAMLATESPGAGETEWSIWMKLSFNTSANNFARIYLASDAPVLDGPVHGYYLQVGGNSDSAAFCRQEGAVTVRLFQCPGFSTNHSLNIIRWTIIRSAEGTWSLYADTTGGEDRVFQGIVTDAAIDTWGWFGVYCKYTSSNAAKFYFDDVYCGPVRRDTIAPAVKTAKITGEQALSVRFSETVQQTAAEDTSHYYLDASGDHPASASRNPDDFSEVLLTFLMPWPADSCQGLHISGIMDPSGNTLQDTSALFCNHLVRAYDVLIHEIMADPDPPVGLPGVEYVELYNRSDFPLDLGGWTFSFGATLKTLPDISVGSHKFLLLSSDTSLSAHGPTIPFLSSWGSLSNEGMRLVLRTPLNQVIHSVDYSLDWFRGSFKQDGGWALEMIDPDNPCACGENWAPSKDPAGGTPGRDNSVLGTQPDTVPPELWGAVIVHPQAIRVDFSENMDSADLVQPTSWRIGDRNPDSVRGIAPGYSSALLYVAAEFSEGETYTATCCTGIPDCAGNRILVPVMVSFGVAETPGTGDIIINEILPEPESGGSRFVELYNRSHKPVNLADLALGCSKDTLSAPLPEGIPVSEADLLLMPESFLAICTDRADVMQHYGAQHPASFLNLPELLPFGPDQGQIVLTRKADAVVLDRLVYDRSMQYPLLTDLAGVSLERISPERTSQDRSNWHSASSLSGYGTPGERNSQWFEASDSGDEFITMPRIFSPDNDGHEDLLAIRIHPDQPGYMASIGVFDSEGRSVRTLANNLLLGDEGLVTWEGLSDAKEPVPAGVYIIVVRVFLPGGKARTLRKATVVATRL